jgi:hypothetical protein
MLASLAPPLPGGSGTFSVGAWNIRWTAHHRGVHRYPSADDRCVRGDPPDPRQMQAGREEAWGNTATLVVGTKDELGRSGHNWIRNE